MVEIIESILSDAVIYTAAVPYTYSFSPGQYIHPFCTEWYSAQQTWTVLGTVSTDLPPVTIQAVEWSVPKLPANLALRDATGQVFFTATSGSCPYSLPTPITVKAPIEYLDSRGGNKIVLFGQFS